MAKQLIRSKYGASCSGNKKHRDRRKFISICYATSTKSKYGGKEKESRLWKKINRAYGKHVAITFHGIKDAMERKVWGVGNMKRFRRVGKTMVYSGVYFADDCDLARAIWHGYSSVANVYWR